MQPLKHSVARYASDAGSMQPHSISRFHFVCASEHQQFRGRGTGRRSKGKMAADFMLLIDLVIFAMVIRCAAALLRETKDGLSAQRCCSSVRRTEGEIRGPHKQAANLGFQLIPLSESSPSSRSSDNSACRHVTNAQHGRTINA